MQNENNIKIFEQLVYNKVVENSGGRIYLNDFKLLYNSYIYEVIGMISVDSSLKSVCEDVFNNKFGFDKKIFKPFQVKQKEFDDIQENPMEITEGVAQCGRCGSKKVLSLAKQTRKSDECTTTFNICTGCNNKWAYSG